MASPRPLPPPPSFANMQLRRDNAPILLALLAEVVGDGPLTAEQVGRLREWLAASTSLDVRGDAFLAQIIARVLADRRISPDDRIELLLAIDRVLPVSEKGFARPVASGASPGAVALPRSTDVMEKREVGTTTSAAREVPVVVHWREQPATEEQRNFIRALGGALPAEGTKGQASDVLESLLAQRSISQRQQRLLRFWGRPLRSGEGPRHVSLWLESLEAEDPDRKRAWDLFRQEMKDDPMRIEPARVPDGIGNEYLARVKLGGNGAEAGGATRRRRRLPMAVWVSCLFAAVGIAAAVRFYLKPSSTEKTAPAVPLTTAAFVANLKIGGAIGGSRMQVMIGDTMYGVGDVVDAARGLMVMKIDNTTRRVTFIDTAGKTYDRSLD